MILLVKVSQVGTTGVKEFVRTNMRKFLFVSMPIKQLSFKNQLFCWMIGPTTPINRVACHAADPPVKAVVIEPNQHPVGYRHNNAINVNVNVYLHRLFKILQCLHVVLFKQFVIT